MFKEISPKIWVPIVVGLAALAGYYIGMSTSGFQPDVGQYAPIVRVHR